MNTTRRIAAGITLAVVTLTACGGSDDEASGPQAELADEAVQQLTAFAESDGFEFDEDCVRSVIGELSDEDAAAGLAALQDPDSDSEAFDATGERIEDECMTFS